jgi:hypothetical protein
VRLSRYRTIAKPNDAFKNRHRPSSAEALRYPWENHPGHDQVVEVRPGVLWVRLKLPFRLNHVNIYLLADGDGWAMVDSGFATRNPSRPGPRCSRARSATSR